MRILGIDPGTERMGYGIAEQQGGHMACVTLGCLTSSRTDPPAARLADLRGKLCALLDAHRPQGAAVERLYFSKNTKTAMGVSQARGMILATLAERRIRVVELSPQHVKQGVTGYGAAPKAQVQRMVQQLFRLPRIPEPDDAADALALAFVGLSHFRIPHP